MPELPEVETVRRRLTPLLEGRRLVDVRVHDERLVRPQAPAAIEAALLDARVGRLDRRGKHLLVGLADGRTLVVHLRMTGNLLHHGDATAAEPSHRRAHLLLDDGTRLDYTDPRRFGTWTLLDGADLDGWLRARLGPEPLGAAFDGAVLRRLLAGRRAPVKALLLDQRLLAGVGNIYADEALHRARVHPATPGGLVGPRVAGRLAEAVREALEAGIEAQGASIRDYRTPGGGYGSMQERFRVFARTGQPCPTCGTAVVYTRVAGRGTHLCPRCQRPPRRPRRVYGATEGA